MDTIRKVAYFSLNVPNRPGEAARILGALRDARIDLLAFSGFPNGRRAQLDFIPSNGPAFTAAARRIGLKLNPKKIGFLAQGTNRPGAVAQIMGPLAAAKINVTAIDAVCAGAGRYGAIFWVKPKDVAKAAKVLGAS